MADDSTARIVFSPSTSSMPNTVVHKISSPSRTKSLTKPSKKLSTNIPSTTPSPTRQRNSGNSPALSGNESSARTVQSIVVVTPTLTETTTVPPETTFSKPVAVTSVQAGTTFIGTPPLVTVLSTSTYSNGSTATWTQVDANPTAATAARSNSFLQNTGAVAGIFAVVGIIAACILLFILHLIRRVYRKSRQSRWPSALPPTRHEHDSDSKTPFYDQDSGLVVHSTPYGPSSPAGSSRMVYHPYDTPPLGASGITVTAESRQWLPETEGPFSDIHAHKGNSIGTAEMHPLRQQMNALGIVNTSVQSTPSIYPTTLPPIESEVESVVGTPVEQLVGRTEPMVMEEVRVEPPANPNEAKPQVAFLAQERPQTADAPPRPPKSALRSRSYSLRTNDQQNPWENRSNPTSSSSGSPSDHSSYQALHAILKQQTLLDVRPRSVHASSTTHARK